MTDKHDYSFFGQKTGLILSSSSSSEPFIFLKCVKKKSDGSWEKLKMREGKTTKISLEEMVMIKKVLDKKSSEWSTFHKHDDNKTNISFKWDQDKININIGDYFKPLTEDQIEIFRALLNHIFYEKIENATSFSNSNNTMKSPSVNLKNNITPQLIVEEVKIYDSNSNIKINGIVNGETDKALLIQFSDQKESWIPKSTIHSEYDKSDNTEQNFIIDEWVLKKNQIL